MTPEYLTPKEMKEKREALGLSIEEIAEITGIRDNDLFLFESLAFASIRVWGDVATKLNSAYSILEKPKKKYPLAEPAAGQTSGFGVVDATFYPETGRPCPQDLTFPSLRRFEARISPFPFTDSTEVIRFSDGVAVLNVDPTKARNIAEWLISAADYFESKGV